MNAWSTTTCNMGESHKHTVEEKESQLKMHYVQFCLYKSTQPALSSAIRSQNSGYLWQDDSNWRSFEAAGFLPCADYIRFIRCVKIQPYINDKCVFLCI